MANRKHGLVCPRFAVVKRARLKTRFEFGFGETLGCAWRKVSGGTKVLGRRSHEADDCKSRSEGAFEEGVGRERAFKPRQVAPMRPVDPPRMRNPLCAPRVTSGAPLQERKSDRVRYKRRQIRGNCVRCVVLGTLRSAMRTQRELALEQLPRRPFRGRMLRHIEMHQQVPAEGQHHEHEQDSKGRRGHP